MTYKATSRFHKSPATCHSMPSKHSGVNERTCRHDFRMDMLSNDEHPGPLCLKSVISNVVPRAFQTQSALIGPALQTTSV